MAADSQLVQDPPTQPSPSPQTPIKRKQSSHFDSFGMSGEKLEKQSGECYLQQTRTANLAACPARHRLLSRTTSRRSKSAQPLPRCLVQPSEQHERHTQDAWLTRCCEAVVWREASTSLAGRKAQSETSSCARNTNERSAAQSCDEIRVLSRS